MTVTVMLCRFWSHNVQDGKSIVLPIKISPRAVSEGKGHKKKKQTPLCCVGVWSP